MSESTPSQPAGWYYAQGDPPGTQRYWDGAGWQGGPQPMVDGQASSTLGGPDLGEPGIRIVARVIDGVIWFVISLIVGLIFGVSSLSLSGDDVSIGSAVLSAVVGGLAVIAYEAVMVGTRGATVGKMVLGLRVANADGSPADMQTGLRRMILYAIFIVIQLIPLLGPLLYLLVAIAGLVLLFTDDRHQTPWDKVGNTIVVKA